MFFIKLTVVVYYCDPLSLSHSLFFIRSLVIYLPSSKSRSLQLNLINGEVNIYLLYLKAHTNQIYHGIDRSTH